MTRPVEQSVLRAVSLVGFLLCLLVAFWGWRTGVLTSQERLSALVESCGAAGERCFTLPSAAKRSINSAGSPVVPAFSRVSYS